MAKNRDSNDVPYLLWFVASFAATAFLLLLAARPLRDLLEHRFMEVSAALWLALLSGVALALVALLPTRTRKLTLTYYSGAALALVGFAMVVWLSPSPPLARPAASVPAAVTARAVASGLPTSAAASAPLPPPKTVQPVLPTVITASPPRPEGACRSTRPAGWRVYVVVWGDTLSVLARRFGTTEEQLMEVNCLASNSLLGVSTLYVPSVAPSQVCIRPPGWLEYIVRRGDTLYGLARALGVSVDELKRVNCLASNSIVAGTILWLPRRPAPAPPSPLPTATPPG